MNRFVFLLVLLFCGTTFADTITINWGVDNQTYTTTTCQTGGDVILPPVSKRGYVFKGWKAEHFNRGTFADWSLVPENTYYEQDVYGNQKPVRNDYIVLQDSSGYDGLDFLSDPFVIKIYPQYAGSKVEITYDGETTTTSLPVSGAITGLNGELKISQSNSGMSISARSRIKTNGRIYEAGETVLGNSSRYTTYSYTVYFPSRISGTWRFVYDGVWEIDGKNGWKPDVQISNE